VESFSEDQRDLRAMLRGFLADKLPSAAVREAIEDPAHGSDHLVRALAVDLELAGLSVPTRYGGTGGTAVEMAILFEELGATLLPGPFFSTVALVGSVLLSTEHEAARECFLPQLAQGELRAALGGSSPDGLGLTAPIGSAERDGSGWTVSGTARAVLDGAGAHLLVVLAASEHGPLLLSVATDQRGVRVEPLTTLDLTRPMATVELDHAWGAVVAAPGDGLATLRRGLELARIALTAEQVGGAQRCLDTTVNYLGLRHQFGRAIGSFQAVKHKAADMLIRVELARSTAYYAASAVAKGAIEADMLMASSIASAYCSDAYLRVATEAIQLHGGIGFTWEHDAHLHYRRARADQLLLGAPRWHRDRIAALVADGVDGSERVA